MLRRNMLTADCQNSGVKGKRLGRSRHTLEWEHSDDHSILASQSMNVGRKSRVCLKAQSSGPERLLVRCRLQHKLPIAPSTAACANVPEAGLSREIFEPSSVAHDSRR